MVMDPWCRADLTDLLSESIHQIAVAATCETTKSQNLSGKGTCLPRAFTRSL